MIRLMFDNIQVAHQEGTNKRFSLVLEKDVNEFFIPKDLFRKRSTEVSLENVLEWIEWRVFPKERVDCTRLLSELGLQKYNSFEIAKHTKACLMEDGWWLSFSDKDTFRKDTVRGKMGFKEWSVK